MSKINELQQQLDEIKDRNKVPLEIRQKQILLNLTTNNVLIDTRMVKDFAKTKDFTNIIYTELQKDCLEIFILNDDDHVIQIGRETDFIDNTAIFSANLNKNIFITKNKLIRFLVNPKCIHPAKIEESLLLLSDLIHKAEYQCIDLTYLLEFLQVNIKL